MQEGVEEYVTRLTKNGYQKDFAFLTATNPPLYDNNCPDLELPDLIRKYNEEGHEQKIRIVTADMLREKLCRKRKSLCLCIAETGRIIGISAAPARHGKQE